MANDVKIEDYNACRECGGRCCKKSGCDYGTGDFFGRSYKGFVAALAEGDKSIVAALDFIPQDDGRFNVVPFLYIRARNTNRDVIDLLSMKTRCMALTDRGCSYDFDRRPLGGRNLIPSTDPNVACYPYLDPMEYILIPWLEYQEPLQKIVFDYTGKTVEEKLREDVENLFFDVICQNYEGVSATERREIAEFVPDLLKAFPLEGVKAIQRHDNLKIYEKKEGQES